MGVANPSNSVGESVKASASREGEPDAMEACAEDTPPIIEGMLNSSHEDN